MEKEKEKKKLMRKYRVTAAVKVPAMPGYDLKSFFIVVPQNKVLKESDLMKAARNEDLEPDFIVGTVIIDDALAFTEEEDGTNQPHKWK